MASSTETLKLRFVIPPPSTSTAASRPGQIRSTSSPRRRHPGRSPSRRTSAAVAPATTITASARSHTAIPPADADEPLVEHELAVPADRLRDDERGEHRRREHLDDRYHPRRQVAPAEQHRARGLEQHRPGADERSRQVNGAARSVRRGWRRRSARPAERREQHERDQAGRHSRHERAAAAQIRREQREEERREGGVEPDRLRVE